MYFLNFLGLLGFIWLQVLGCTPKSSYSSQDKLQKEIPSGIQFLCISYFDQDSGKYCAIPIMPPQKYLYYDKYFVTVLETTLDSSMTDLDSVSHQLVTSRTISSRIDWYDLINLERRKYTRYASFTTTAIKREEGIISRRVNFDEFNDYSSAMSVVRDLSDTVIDNQKFKRVLLKSDTSVTNFIAYFEPTKVESPLQLSKILNARYNATLVKFEIFLPKGDRLALEMKYQRGSLTDEQKKVIAQWIKNEN